MKETLRIVGKNILNFVIGMIIGIAVLMLFLYFRLGKLGFQKTYEEYYLHRMKLPSSSKIRYAFTGDIHGLKRDSMIFVTQAKSVYFYRKSTNPLRDNSQVIIFDESFPSFWEILLPQLGGLKEPSFRFLPVPKESHENKGREMQPLEAYDQEITDLDGNNTKEVVIFWINYRGASFLSKHVMIIYWDGKYKIAGMPPISKDVRLKIDRFTYEIKIANYYDKKVHNFATFSTDDLLYFKDIDKDGNTELIRGLMVWGEGEAHVDPHQYLFEVFKWENNDWEQIYWKNTNAPYILSPKIDVWKEDIKSFIEEYISKNLWTYED